MLRALWCYLVLLRCTNSQNNYRCVKSQKTLHECLQLSNCTGTVKFSGYCPLVRKIPRTEQTNSAVFDNTLCMDICNLWMTEVKWWHHKVFMSVNDFSFAPAYFLFVMWTALSFICPFFLFKSKPRSQLLLFLQVLSECPFCAVSFVCVTRSNPLSFCCIFFSSPSLNII